MAEDNFIKIKKSKLEEIVEKKVEEKLKQENSGNSTETTSSEGLNRRQFLKKSAIGLGGLAALTLPGKALEIRGDSFNVLTGDFMGQTQYFSVDQDGPVNVTNTNLDLNSNNLIDVNQINGTDADEIGEGGVPSGVIAMWSGDVSNIPNGWVLCDGSDGTPDLTDRFIVGAGSSYNGGDIGGEEEVQLDESEMPSHDHGSGNLSTTTDGEHTHDVYRRSLSGGSGYPDGNADDQISYETDPAGDHSHEVSGSTSPTGGDESHENRPPYYALAFIMKV